MGGTGANLSSSYFGTLAAGYAEVEDFNQAIKLQKQVVSMLKNNHPHFAEEEMRLRLYESKKPFRQAEP